MIGLGVASTLYLSNIGVGIVEFIPDNLPVVGNIDEAIATLILLKVLAYFGIASGATPLGNRHANKAVDSTR